MNFERDYIVVKESRGKEPQTSCGARLDPGETKEDVGSDVTSGVWSLSGTTGASGISAGCDAQEVTPWRRYLVVEGVAMGGAERLWSSWNLGFLAGNVRAKLGPVKGGSCRWWPR